MSSGNDPILFSNPRASYLEHRIEIDRAIQAVLDAGQYILGPQVANFEQEFSTYLEGGPVVGTASGTDALLIALKVCGISSGDAVITVSHTAVATVAAIELCGATPLLIDIHPDSLTMDPDRLAAAIDVWSQEFGKRLKAVIPVHLYGYPANMPAIMEVIRSTNLMVIEDSSQAHGARIQSLKTGTWGQIGVFSFYPTKNLAALGDAGAFTTKDPSFVDKARELRQYGWRKRYVSENAGMNSRLDELQAAILRVKLRYLDVDNMRRNEIAKKYDSMLSRVGVRIPHQSTDTFPVYHQYVIRTRNRGQLQEYLLSRHIHTGIHYPIPVHLQPAYRNRVIIDPNGLKVTEEVCEQILSLPMYPQLTDDQVASVVEGIAEWNRGRAD